MAKHRPRVEISKKLVLFNSTSSLVALALNVSVLLWVNQYLLKRITPEEYSLLPVVYSIMVFVPLVTTVLTAGLGRYILESYAKGDDEGVTRIVSTMFPILCGAGLLFATAGGTFAWHIDKVLTIPPERLWDARAMMGMLMLSAAIRLVLSPFCSGFFVRQKFVLQNFIRVSTDLCRIALLFGLLFGVSTRVLWVVTASEVAGLLNIIITFTISRRLLPALRFRPSQVRWQIARNITSFGGWSFIASTANTIRSSADILLLNTFASALDVSCFHVGSMAPRQIQQVSSTARMPLAPVLTAMYATGSTDRLRNAYLRGGRLGLWAVLFAILPLMIYSREIVALYAGELYSASATVMVLLLAGPVMGHGAVMLAQIAAATGHVREFAIRQSIIHLGNLAFTYYLVAVLDKGAIGSALATFMALLILQSALLYPLGLRLVEATWSMWLRETILPALAPALVGAAIWGGLKLYVQPETWLSLGLCTAAGAVAYLTFIAAFGLRSSDRADVARLMERIPRPRPRSIAPASNGEA